MSDISKTPDETIKPHWAAKQADQYRVQAEDFMRVYSNNFGMSINNWDASLVFGEIVGEKDGQPVIEEKVKVLLPLSMLKAISQLLAINVAGFEKQFGEIIIPNITGFQSPSASPSSSPSASVSPSSSASPSPENDEED